MGRLRFNEISKERFKESRNVVISEAIDCNTGETIGYSISEQLVSLEGDREVKVFLKGGLGIVDGGGLLELKKAVDKAISHIGLE